jgi:hypothetical protein
MKQSHSYLSEKSGFCGMKRINEHSEVSEVKHMEMLNEMSTKISHEVFRKTPAEHQQLKDRMLKYPNKNHKPIPPNS